MRSAYATDPAQTIVAAVFAVATTVAILLALLTLDRLPIVLSHVVAPVAVFDVPLPPPPPPPPPPPEPAPRPAMPVHLPASAKTTGSRRPDPGIGRPRADIPSPDAMVSIPSISIAPPPPIPAGPGPTGDGAASTGTGDGGTGGTGVEGNGSGAGVGGLDPSGWGRAIWVRPPTEADFLREWPIAARRLPIPVVDVVMRCAVKENGRPHGCKVVRESVRGKGFGRAAIRLTEAALVRPATRDGVRTKLPVLVSLTFERVAAKPARTDANRTR